MVRNNNTIKSHSKITIKVRAIVRNRRYREMKYKGVSKSSETGPID